MKKKLRKIVVQGLPFWWKAHWFYHSDERRIICVRIWGDDKRGSPLYVNITSKRLEYPVYSSYPLPKDIGAIIVYALAHGWHPSTRGAPHWLKANIDHLALEHFVLTDIGRYVEEASTQQIP